LKKGLAKAQSPKEIDIEVAKDEKVIEVEVVRENGKGLVIKEVVLEIEEVDLEIEEADLKIEVGLEIVVAQKSEQVVRKV